jgi:hypothetical protein
VFILKIVPPEIFDKSRPSGIVLEVASIDGKATSYYLRNHTDFCTKVLFGEVTLDSLKNGAYADNSLIIVDSAEEARPELVFLLMQDGIVSCILHGLSSALAGEKTQFDVLNMAFEIQNLKKEQE